jgi:hypothetical protein
MNDKKTSLPWAKAPAKPIGLPPGASPFGSSQSRRDTHDAFAAAEPLAACQALFETQGSRADGTSTGGGQRSTDTQPAHASSGYLKLRVWAEMLEDQMQERIRQGNRVERAGVDPTPYMAQLDVLARVEKDVGRAMRLCYRDVVDPEIVSWQKTTKGIGDHLLARLLGVIGHPRHTVVHRWEGTGKERTLVELGAMERSVSQLWSYCGVGDPSRRRRSGMTAEDGAALGNPRAKMLIHLIADHCQMCRTSPYRDLYEQARVRYAGRVHVDVCPQCHAKAGDPWRPGHQHAAALRLVAKTILKDLWIVSGDGQ